jgi:hypothetical protein
MLSKSERRRIAIQKGEQMNQVLDEALFKKYTSLFQPEEIRNDMRQSCMCWGFECGNGWYDILDRAFTKLVELKLEDFYIEQVKEKYGGLRIYTNYTNDEIEKIIDQAEHEAEKTCEMCGEPSKIASENHWYSTECVDCKIKRKAAFLENNKRPTE